MITYRVFHRLFNAIMWIVCLLYLVCTLVLMAAGAHAQATNTPSIVPGAPATVTALWELGIPLVAPFIIAGVAKLLPKIPKVFLPALTPAVGILLGLLLNWLGKAHLGLIDMAKAGALAVFVREVFNQGVSKYLTQSAPPEIPIEPPK